MTEMLSPSLASAGGTNIWPTVGALSDLPRSQPHGALVCCSEELEGQISILRFLARAATVQTMYGSTPLAATRVSSLPHQLCCVYCGLFHCSHSNFRQRAERLQARLQQKHSSQQANSLVTFVKCTHARCAGLMYSLMKQTQAIFWHLIVPCMIMAVMLVSSNHMHLRPEADMPVSGALFFMSIL